MMLLAPVLALIILTLSLGGGALSWLVWLTLVYLPLPLGIAGLIGSLGIAVCAVTKKPREAVIAGIGTLMMIGALILWLASLVLASPSHDLAITLFHDGPT